VRGRDRLRRQSGSQDRYRPVGPHRYPFPSTQGGAGGVHPCQSGGPGIAAPSQCRDAGRRALRSARGLAVTLRRCHHPAPGDGNDPAHESAQDPCLPGMVGSSGVHRGRQRGTGRGAGAGCRKPSGFHPATRAIAGFTPSAGRALPQARRGQQLASAPGWGSGPAWARGDRLMAQADDIRAVRESGLFDLGWFRERCPGAPGEEAAAVAHFLDNGMALGLDPGPGFSMRRYLLRNPDVAAAGMNPLLHYLAYGRREGRMALPVDEQGVDDAGSGVATPEPPAPRTLERWSFGLASLRGSWLFGPDFYLDRNPDVRAANLDPLRHFVEHGAGEGRWPNPWFDPSWYRAREQPRGDESNPLFHYAH